MSIFNDYSHQILHHQVERELIRLAELDRMVAESREPAAGSRRLGGRIRRFFALQTGRAAPTLPANGARHHVARHRYAH